MIVLFAAKDGEALARTRMGADCGSVHELFIAKFRLNLKKVQKTTRPLWNDPNQMRDNYTVEVTKIFQGIRFDRVPEELWTKVCDIIQEAMTKTIRKKKKYKEAKWLSAEALQIAVKRREAKGKG